MHPSFGRYELLKRIAGGGMGEVYLARQRGIDGFSRMLVLKTLLPHLCEDEEFITMFKDEARVTAQLIHPNICQVFEFEQVGGVYYMAMEYLRGDDLRRLWKACEARGAPLRVPLICRIIADAAAGLDFAHSLHDADGQPYNIVHRDISPQNILVTFEGGVKVIDFGVAKAAGRAQHTRTGALKGKYSYMSPEQVAGAAVDNRSDIFALGIVLHELLTGRRLFKADSDVQTLARVRECHVPPPSRLNPQLPVGLDPIVQKALSKDPNDRYHTAQEFRLALEDWLIQERMSASSAHLAEFLKVIYAERLEKESRFGPLLGEPGFTGPGPGSATPSRGITPATPTTDAPGQPTTDQRTPVSASEAGKSQIGKPLDEQSTQRSDSRAAKRNRLLLALGAVALTIGVTTLVLLRSPRAPVAPPDAQLTLDVQPSDARITVDGQPSGARISHRPGLVQIAVTAEGYEPGAFPVSLAPGANPPQQVVLQKSGPKLHMVTVLVEPVGAEIYEGTRLIGQSPKIWSDATEGEHELKLVHEGYKDETGKVLVVKDGEEFHFKLHKNEAAKKPAPDLGIKAER
jgi:serine/threonine-protein kinase